MKMGTGIDTMGKRAWFRFKGKFPTGTKTWSSFNLIDVSICKRSASITKYSEKVQCVNDAAHIYLKLDHLQVLYVRATGGYNW